MTQAKGSNATFLIGKETEYGATPGSPACLAFPFDPPLGLKADRNQIESETILGTGSRNPTQPDDGNKKVSGAITIPIDLRYFGYHLSGLIGAPNSTQVAAKALNNGAAAVDRSGGVVGLPCTNHGFQAGETITIANTTNYNGDKVVLASSTTNEIRVAATYQAENMGATSTARAKRYTHIFKITENLDSHFAQIGFPDINTYYLYNGMKYNKGGFKFGGDQKLVCSMDLIAADEIKDVTSIDATPDILTLRKFAQFQAALKEGGATLATSDSIEFNYSNNLDTSKYCIGGGGRLGSAAEGVPTLDGSLSCMFDSGTLYDKAKNKMTSSLQVTLTDGVWSLDFLIEEVNYKLGGPGVDTKQGIWQKLNFFGFFASGVQQSALVATLINDVPNYTWP